MANKNSRVQSIDLLRGIVMIIMALDHVRDYIHYGSTIDQNPLNFSTTTPFLFLTRWITHFCAPVFVFLSGTSIFLYSSKGKTKKEVALFLLSRGLFLMIAEIFLILPLWDFNFTMIYLQVIWAIGISMVILSVLQYFPIKILLVIGLLIVFGHNILDAVIVDAPLWKTILWSIVHVKYVYQFNDDLLFIVMYPFLPWLGLMILGYCAGKLFLPETDAGFRRKILLMTGTAAIVLFFILRCINVYGDMHPWEIQGRTVFTIFDFINASKYPPSLLYILMTIGPALIIMSLLENKSDSVISKKIIVFGKVPFFYYVLHVFLIHSVAWLIFFATGHSWTDLDFNHFRNGSLPFASGQTLWVVYVVWIAVVIILYFPCRWYANFKAAHKHWWLSYV